jgi:hypothetical protein
MGLSHGLEIAKLPVTLNLEPPRSAHMSLHWSGHHRSRTQQRRGSALVLLALLLVPLLGIVAFGVDIGVICVSKAELQRSADSAAMAAAWELLDAQGPASNLTPSGAAAEARDAAKEYARLHSVLANQAMQLADADVDIGYSADPLNSLSLDYRDPSIYNVVRVTTRRDQTANSPVPAFFARMIGHDHTNVTATSTGAFINGIRGFRPPQDPSQKAPLLPFALDNNTWRNALAGQGPDLWRWDKEEGKFVHGSDGVPEFNLYPQDTGSTANRGTVNIGISANSTSHVARQILEGVSSEDFAFHGGELTFNQQLELSLNGNPGISAGFKDELRAIRGQPRIAPVFSAMSGNGNNGVYTIVEWAGLRIADVHLTGGTKGLIAQPAKVTTSGAIPGGDPNRNRYVTSAVWLAQ